MLTAYFESLLVLTIQVASIGENVDFFFIVVVWQHLFMDHWSNKSSKLHSTFATCSWTDIKGCLGTAKGAAV